MCIVPTLADNFEHDELSCMTDLLGDAHNNVMNKICPGRGIIDMIAREQGCGKTMEELQLQQRQMSGKGYNGPVY
jgi:hypothetical protein